MRLWSLHPKYLDAKGLVALWREALLAQAVLCGKTRGYRRHPQLQRFREAEEPLKVIAEYLKVVHAEATRRGYRFDATKIGHGGRVEKLVVTTGQLNYEWVHLRRKLEARAPEWFKRVWGVGTPQPHPLFRLVEGGIGTWEKPQVAQDHESSLSPNNAIEAECAG